MAQFVFINNQLYNADKIVNIDCRNYNSDKELIIHFELRHEKVKGFEAKRLLHQLSEWTGIIRGENGAVYKLIDAVENYAPAILENFK